MSEQINVFTPQQWRAMTVPGVYRTGQSPVAWDGEQLTKWKHKIIAYQQGQTPRLCHQTDLFATASPNVTQTPPKPSNPEPRPLTQVPAATPTPLTPRYSHLSEPVRAKWGYGNTSSVRAGQALIKSLPPDNESAKGHPTAPNFLC